MLSCSTIRARISEFVDGRLPAEDAGRFESHLASCADCTQVHASLIALAGWARSFPVYPAPEFLVPRILERTAAVAVPLACSAVEEHLSEYIEGELAANADRSVADHLSLCTPCHELRDSMVAALGWARTTRTASAPDALVARILAGTSGTVADGALTLVPSRCESVRESLSDYLDQVLSPTERERMETHLTECPACLAQRDGMVRVIQWARRFPRFAAPPWLVSGILANTADLPVAWRRQRETWLETLASIGRWILEPRTAMAVFTSVLILGWMSNVAGVEAATLRNPASVYYTVESLADDVYDRSVRLYYEVPQTVVDQIQYRVEQLRESAE